MRKSAGGGYGDDSSGGNPHAYMAASSLYLQQQQQYSRADHQQNRNQWRWERDGSKLSSPMSPHMLNEVPGNETSRSYYQAQRPEPRMGSERQGSRDSRSQPRGEEMSTRYEENVMLQRFEGLEQKFLDDITRLSKEQSDAEDTEITRHRERINAINVQYQEQLVALRAQHATRREELLLRESHLRQEGYKQASKDQQYPGSGPRAYGGRSKELEARVQYPGGRVHDTGSRYY